MPERPDDADPHAGGGRRVALLERGLCEGTPAQFLLPAPHEEHEDDRDRVEPQRIDGVEVDARPEDHRVDESCGPHEQRWQDERPGVPSCRDADPQVRPQPCADTPVGRSQGDERPNERAESADSSEDLHRGRRNDSQ